MTLDPHDIEYFKILCSREGHRAECIECISTRADLCFECEECGRSKCLRCTPPNGRLTVTNLYGSNIDFVGDPDDPDDECQGLEYGKSTPLMKDPLYGFKGLRPDFDLRPHNPIAKTLSIQRATQFELCDGCDSATCSACIIQFTNKNMFQLSYRAGTTLYTPCNQGCDRIFCTECDGLYNRHTCGWCVCTRCQRESRQFDTPLEADIVWCNGRGCVGDTGMMELEGLRGPWEDGWVEPPPVQIPVEAILGVIGNSDPAAALDVLRRASEYYAASLAGESRTP